MKRPSRQKLTVAELEALLAQAPASATDTGVFSRAMAASGGQRCSIPYCPEPHAVAPEPVNPPFVSLRQAGDETRSPLWRLTQGVWRGLWNAWVLLREVSGDAAYERYLAHMYLAHPGRPALTQREYYLRRLDQNWSRIARCC